MRTVQATIHAGVCGFVTRVEAVSDDEQRVRFAVTTPCENIRRLADRLPEVDALAEIGAGFAGEIHRAARESLKGCCSACVVPNGVYKAMQIAAGLALPRSVSLEFQRTEP